MILTESDLGYGSQTARNSKTTLDLTQCLHTLLLLAHLYVAKLDNECTFVIFKLKFKKWCLPSGEERQDKALRTLACVVWQFWLGVLSNKGEQGQRNRKEIGAGAT